MRRLHHLISFLLPGYALLLLFPAVFSFASEQRESGNAADAELREWIGEMKSDARGPFARIRWFCNDGTVLPPQSLACRNHGGGIQHGEWNERAQMIRARSFSIANVFAELEPADVLATDANLLQQLLLEQFLINVDDGWIFRRARFYRGAFQAENEAAATRQMLKALLFDQDWLDKRLLLIYEAARLLPHGAASGELARIRADAAILHDKDPGFSLLRNKIHGKPDPGDAQSVRVYASRFGLPELADDYAALAAAIDEATDLVRIRSRLRSIAAGVTDPSLRELLGNIQQDLGAVDDQAMKLHAAAMATEQLRRRLPGLVTADDRLAAVDATIVLEQSIVAAGQTLHENLEAATRQTQIAWLEDLGRASYGGGLLTEYEWRQLQKTIAMLGVERIDLARFRVELKALSRTTSWAQRRLALHFERSIEKFSALDPLVMEFIPDRLRGSSMLMYSAILESLLADTNRLAGVRHNFFGKTVATGLRSLNPGLASGILMTAADYARDPAPGIPKILLVAETLADLPPVDGILTEHEGNQLSHVQLLARNLGIPNVVIDRDLLAQIDAHRGKPVTLASSPGGIVSLTVIPEADFSEALAARQPDPAGRIVVDLDKLDVVSKKLTSVSELRAVDSGVTVGPKAAQLGELMFRYPGTVSAGLAIPFGAFRDLLNQKFEGESGESAFEWLQGQYAELAKIDDPTLHARRQSRILARIRDWILNAEFDPHFLATLKRRMADEFGAEGSYGVFVRSDTNVEDLPGFTGAGLNLTVHNVVGFENTVRAIRRVWASPFTERAFGWRQALMDKPEHLYTAVLLHLAVNSHKSGVMVTSNIFTGANQEITIVTNEGVGGGVEGQSAETLVVHTGTREIRLHSSATAPLKRILLDEGGSGLVPVDVADRLLSDANVNALVDLAADIDTWFKSREDGSQQVADVEFGFFDEQLVLFQIRPLVENSAAASNEQLLRLDAPLRLIAAQNVDLMQTAKNE